MGPGTTTVVSILALSLDGPARRELAGRGVGYAETALTAIGERVDTLFFAGALLADGRPHEAATRLQRVLDH